MPKKLKTDAQILALQKYFSKKQDKWPKNQLISLAKITGLSRSQVYKWLWDQRNLMKQQMKNQAESYKTDYFTKNDKTKFEALTHKASNPKKYRKVYLHTAFQEIQLSVPMRMQFCQKFIVSSKVQPWALHILKKHGSQLTRLETQQHEFSQKVENILDFNEVKEEHQGMKCDD